MYIVVPVWGPKIGFLGEVVRSWSMLPVQSISNEIPKEKLDELRLVRYLSDMSWYAIRWTVTIISFLDLSWYLPWCVDVMPCGDCNWRLQPLRPGIRYCLEPVGLILTLTGTWEPYLDLNIGISLSERCLSTVSSQNSNARIVQWSSTIIGLYIWILLEWTRESYEMETSEVNSGFSIVFQVPFHIE